MTEASSGDAKQRTGRTADGRRQLRGALAVAALDLFAAKGYEATTVEDIVTAVGVGRRTFFRHFRSKEEVVFPDHDERLTSVVRELEQAGESEPPMAVVCRAAETVLEMYLADPEVSLKRFELTRQVPSLRDREIVSIDRYQRVFARYLRQRFAELPGAELRAAVTAATVVATHNHVLRRWLKSGGVFDARAALREALREMAVGEGSGTSPESPDGAEEVVVGVVRTSKSAHDVRDRVERALREIGGTGSE
ncbi:TetR family transcriptional regulator [Actinopolyspora erythraea]|uniref:TetR family transcriptional regulator n=1 Tax=Actinopolyspora erythraea TaxID=414996 RepID=A0A099D5M6_9ACTN|nr:TetR family transcriptional regulator [Actinopolyspora erythraea]ASU78699.1 TetR family transcriptional regulator [Actinopolyspora erythraea]KGI81453.1 TetR family transcriptional regulator [Actinopolyspora erythraea]